VAFVDIVSTYFVVYPYVIGIRRLADMTTAHDRTSVLYVGSENKFITMPAPSSTVLNTFDQNYQTMLTDKSIWLRAFFGSVDLWGAVYRCLFKLPYQR
jgi:hypothetical protein